MRVKDFLVPPPVFPLRYGGMFSDDNLSSIIVYVVGMFQLMIQFSIRCVLVSIRCALGDIRLWVGDTSTSSCLV